MEWFDIIVMNAQETYVSSLSSLIENELRLLHNGQEVVAVRIEWNEKSAHIRGERFAIDHGAAVERKKVMEKLAEVLADHIIAVREPGLLRQLIVKEFKYETKEDIELIEGYCKQFLFGENGSEEAATPVSAEAGRKRRKHLLVQQVSQYFEEQQKVFNLDGFLKFRLQDYLDELREVVEYAVDEYMMDRQYQEFISLLQYFVYIQEAKIPAAHLIHKGGHEFVILNDQLEPIDANEFDATFKLEVLEKDINFEDMIVSTLITVSPANIYIHTRDPEMTVIKTIRQIFEDRTTVCAYCRTCHSYLGEAKKQDQLSP